jgi:stage II sporulation protein D
MDVMRHLGQTGCFREGGEASVEAFDVAALARLLAEALCWERRLPFLVSSFDATTLIGDGLAESDRLYLAYTVEAGLIVPDAEGIRKGEPLSRRAVVDVLYRVLSRRGEPPLRRGRILSFEPDFERLTILEERSTGDESEVSMTLAPVRYLYRSVEGSAYHSTRVTLLPNDRVRFHAGEGGIDVLVVEPSGASFDRSSRFSHWVVRKSADEIEQEANRAGTVGEVRELRPRRYGASGRIVELEVVGSAGSVVLRGLAIRRTLGIRENLFFLYAQQPPEGGRRSWVFTGRGWGHGVGLCQVGAYGMAAAGYGYREILGHYYPGTAILARSVDKKPYRP